MPDYYAVLGVPRDASSEDIKRAYRKLARQHHPDANQSDPASEERFKAIAEAYEVLSDPARRQRYDTFGDDREQGFGFGGFSDLGDIMETFFGGSPFGGGRRRRAGPERGDDLAVAVEISLEEAARGLQRDVGVDDLVRCERCGGSACEPGTSKTRCDRCGGTGQLRHQQRTILGTVMTSRPCPTCDGGGEIPASPCHGCSGAGVVRGRIAATVQIPGGIADGMSMRVAGRGRPGPRGGPSGDLYVRVSVRPHPIFERDGDDLHCSVSVPFTVAALGGEVDVPTLEGAERVRIDAGTQPGEMHRLRGRGVDRLERSGRGDVVVHLDVEVPRDLTAEQREVISRLAELRGEAVDDAAPGLVGKLKGSFRKQK